MARLLPLALSATASSWRMDDGDHRFDDPVYRANAAKAFARDACACRYCGFSVKQGQEIAHIDDNHANHDLTNLATACSFCHLCQHLGRAGLLGEAVVIWLPEMSQAVLHHLVRAIAVALPVAVMHDAARAALAALKGRQEAAKALLGTSSPLSLGNVLIDLKPPDYKRRRDLLGGIRLLPLPRKMDASVDRFPAMVEDWMRPRGPFGGLRPQDWPRLLDGIVPA
jgi:intracellular multiplication protein IcmJ